MKIKTLTAFTETGLDKKVNEFLYDAYVEVIDIKFAMSIYSISAMIIYKDK